MTRRIPASVVLVLLLSLLLSFGGHLQTAATTQQTINQTINQTNNPCGLYYIGAGTCTTSTTGDSTNPSAGIPEFPVQLGFALLVAIVIVMSYVFARHGLRIDKQTPV